MGAVASPELCAAVAHEGGIAMIGTAMRPPAEVGATLDAMVAAGTTPVGANVLVPMLDLERVTG